jgi:DNA adenine methylase
MKAENRRPTVADDYATPMSDMGKKEGDPVRAPFGYYGAKQRIAKQIVGALPPHYAWVEAFCGSAALTLAKLPAPIEVINDLDGQVVNLFEQLRSNSKALCEAIALTPYARAEFQKARESRAPADALERARRFLVSTMMTVNGTVGNEVCGFSFSMSYAREEREARVNRWYNLPARLENVVERLRSVRVENRDARELLEMFVDRPATLVYLDPPYFVRRDHGYTIDANNEQFHTELLEICRRARCMILLSGYDNKLYRRMLRRKDGWTRTTIKTHTRDTTGNDYARNEVLWKNAEFTKAKKTNRVPIRLSAEERYQNKINPARPRNRRCQVLLPGQEEATSDK